MALNTRDLAFNEAQSQLSRNNSTASPSFTRALSLLEGAEGSAELRRKIIAYLQARADEDSLPIQENAFRALPTLKGKLAHIVALSFPDTPTTSRDLANIRGQVMSRLETRLREIHNDLLVESDLSPSFVIRHAALNRVDLEFKQADRVKMLQLCTKLSGLKGVNEDMRASFHFSDETDAQRIMKLQEGVYMLVRSGISVDPADITTVETLVAKLDKLRTLDDKFHGMSASWNEFMRRNRGDVVGCILSRGEERAMKSVLTACGITDMSTYIQTLKEKGGEAVDLLEELRKIVDHPKFTESILACEWREDLFKEKFLKHFSYLMAQGARQSLDRTKVVVFGDKKREFDLDVTGWRTTMRNRVLSLDPVNDIGLLNGYFEKDRKIFHADRREPVYADMLTRLGAIVAVRYPSITDPVERNQLAETILGENQSRLEVFYGNRNPFDDKREDEEWRKRFWGRVSDTGKGIKHFADKSTPVIAALVNGIEFGVRNAAKGATYLGEGLGWSLREGAEKYNEWVNKEQKGFLRKAARLPFKISLLLTKPIQWTGQFSKWGFNGLRTQGGKLYDATNAKIDTNVHAGTNTDLKSESLRMGSWSDVSGLAGLITQIYHKGLGTIGGKGLDNLGDWRYDATNREQQQRIIQNLYATHNSQEIRNGLEQMDLMASLQDDAEYIFDDDGVLDTTSVAAEKKTEAQEDKDCREAYEAVSGSIKTIMDELEARKSNLPNEAIQQKSAISQVLRHFQNLHRQLSLPMNVVNRNQLISQSFESILKSFGDNTSRTTAIALAVTGGVGMLGSIPAAMSNSGLYGQFALTLQRAEDRVTSRRMGNIPDQITAANKVSATNPSQIAAKNAELHRLNGELTKAHTEVNDARGARDFLEGLCYNSPAWNALRETYARHYTLSNSTAGSRSVPAGNLSTVAANIFIA